MRQPGLSLKSALGGAALSLVLGAGPAWGQAIQLTPGADPYADPPVIELNGFAPGSEVTLTAERASDRPGQVWRSQAVFRAGAEGRILVGEAEPLSGDWTGREPAGPFWSMRRVEVADRPVVETPAGQVVFSASDGRSQAGAEWIVETSAPDLTLTTVDGFAASVLALPPGEGPFPVVIVLGGSEGGSSVARDMAPRLASYGFAVVGLPYYAPPYGEAIEGLPQAFSRIPVDRLARLREALTADPRLDTDRLAVWGASKGAEFALIAGAAYDWIDAVIAIVPSDVVWEGWGQADPGPSFALDGRPLDFVPYVGIDAIIASYGTADPGRLRDAHDQGRWTYPERVGPARIPVERIEGPVLVAGGDQDPVWASATMAAAIAETRAAAGLPTVLVNRLDAGHGLSQHPLAPVGQPFGGSVSGNAQARAEIWRQTIALLTRVLTP